MILLLTNRTDIHPNPVIGKVEALGGELFRLNTDDLLKANGISCYADKGAWVIRNARNGRSVRAEEVGAVWERRPSQPMSPRTTPRNAYDDLIEKEAAEFVRWFRHALEDVVWLGHPIYDSWAGSKLRQLGIAGRLGARVPKTYVGNVPEEFREWCAGVPQLAIKPLDADCFETGGEEYCFFTRRIDAAQAAAIPSDSFAATINYVQEYVEKKRELRVTVVGDRSYTCAIDSQAMGEKEGRLDWRQGCDQAIPHLAVDTPTWVHDFCIQFLKEVNLSFGCFDFIETPGNEYVFLECNPNGQWLWIEEETGLQISAGIAEFLVEADHGRKS